MTDLLIFRVLVAILLVGGVRLGMLIAPRLGAWAERHEEPPDDDD
ncbi:MAG: hypothetical protein ACXWNG_06010 [Candidatus Limnocylindrales bacterium]